MAKGDITGRFHKGSFYSLPDKEGVPMMRFTGECHREIEELDGAKADLEGCVVGLDLPRSEFDALIAKAVAEAKKKYDKFKDLTIS